MANNLIQYKVKPGRGAENEAMIRRVFEELHLVAPEGLRYASFIRSTARDAAAHHDSADCTTAMN